MVHQDQMAYPSSGQAFDDVAPDPSDAEHAYFGILQPLDSFIADDKAGS